MLCLTATSLCGGSRDACWVEGEGNSRKVFVLEKGREAGNEGELEGFAADPCLPKSVCFSAVRSRGSLTFLSEAKWRGHGAEQWYRTSPQAARFGFTFSLLLAFHITFKEKFPWLKYFRKPFL